LASCELCGSNVNVDGAVGVCEGCGAEYEVIRHGSKRDFSRSAEAAVNAQLKPTDMKMYLWDAAFTKRMEGQTVYTGTKIIIRLMVYSTAEGRGVSPNPSNVSLYRKIDAGAYERIWVGGWTADSNDIEYTFDKPGTHTFYADFPGNAYYAGCEEKTHAMKVANGDYSLSPEVSVNALPALTVVVKDVIFKKPLEGAKVVLDSSEFLTDASGMVVFETLAPGTYTITVSASDFKSETRTVELTAAGMVVEVHLWHLGAIVAGVAAVGAVGVVAAVKLRRRK